MNVRDAIIFIRDDYLEQLNAMVALQRAQRPDVYVERRIDVPDSKLFGRTYVPDVSFGDPMTEWWDMVPRERAAPIPHMLFDYPKLSVEFEDLWWDDVQFEHNGTFTAKLVSWWFHRWMPPVNPSTPRPEDLVGFIHSATVDEKWICIDFGTASIDALFNLMSVAINCGATTARVTSTRDRKQNRNGAAHSFLTH